MAVPTRFGTFRATLDLGGRPDPAGPAGLGQWVRADRAPESWEGAVIALRLTTPLTPVVDATALGAMIVLARAHDPAAQRVERADDVLQRSPSRPSWARSAGAPRGARAARRRPRVHPG